MIPSYDEYQKETTKILDKWVDKVFHGGKIDARVAKEEAEDAIAAWKKMYPQSAKKISSYIDSYLRTKFS